MRLGQNSFLIPWLYVHTASAQIVYGLVYSKNFVRHAARAECTQLPPPDNFITSLNNTNSKIKLENLLPRKSAGDSKVSDGSVSSSMSRYPFGFSSLFFNHKPESNPGVDNIRKYSRSSQEVTDLYSTGNPILYYFLKTVIGEFNNCVC